MTRRLKRILTSQLFLGILLVGAYMAYMGIRDQRDNNWTKDRIQKKFSENLVLIKHDYAIKLIFDDHKNDPIYLVRNEEGNYQQWKKGVVPNTVYGCGFVTNEKGDCITSREVTWPIPRTWDKYALQREINLIREMLQTTSKGHYEIFTVSIGYFPSGTNANDEKSFFACINNGYFDSGISELKAQAASKSTKKRPQFSRVQYRNKIENNESVFVLGLPLEMNRGDNIKAVTGETAIDSIVRVQGSFQDWREIYFRLPSLFLFEGAPVFNRKGNIVGVMTVDDNGYKASFTTLERK